MNDDSETSENKFLNTLSALSKKIKPLARRCLIKVHSGIEFCGKHPFATGFFALIGLVGLVLSMYSFQLDREEYKSSTQQLDKSFEKIAINLINKHQSEVQAKNDQIKALTQAISDLSKGQDILGSQAQIDAALAALSQGDTEKAKQLFANAAEKGDQEALQTAKAYRNLGALAHLDNTQQALKAYSRATELDPNNPDGWNKLGHLLRRVGELDQAIVAYKKVMSWGKSHQDKQYIAIAYGNLGLVYQTRGELDKAIEFHQKALVIDEALGRKEGMANQYGNLGIVYQTRGELDKAIEFHQKALVIDEALGRKEGMANQYGNLGIVYKTRGELDKAIEFYQKALVIDEALGRKEGMANQYGNLGNVYQTRGELDQAIEFYQKALVIDEALGRKEGMARNYGNLGIVYRTRGELDQAIEFYQKALVIDEALGSKEGIAANYGNLGLVYHLQGNPAEAKRYWLLSLKLFKELGSPNAQKVQSLLDKLKVKEQA